MKADAAVWCFVGSRAKVVRNVGWSPLPLEDRLNPAYRDTSELVPWIRGLWAVRLGKGPP